MCQNGYYANRWLFCYKKICTYGISIYLNHICRFFFKERATYGYAYANRLDPGQPPSNSVVGLRSNLFATIMTHKKQAEFTGFNKQATI